jgi:hypothetical protein
MTEPSLRRVLRRVLLLSLAGSVAACGGAFVIDPDDAGETTDASRKEDVVTPKPDAGCKNTPTSTNDVGCGFKVTYPCGVPHDGGTPDWAACEKLCAPGGRSYGCRLESSTTLECYTCVEGRRPAGLAAARLDRSSALAAYFARAAHLEAASIDAFEMLEAELVEHGAPSRLCEQVRRAAKDEVRHAKIMGAFARRFGTEPPAPVVEARRARSLEEIATENAVEGCVRETFGALVAMWQAERAGDPAVAGAMRKIAEDELFHAALAWEIAAWADTKLDVAARKRVAFARRRAARELLRDAGQGVPREVVALAGLPDARAAVKLARIMIRETSRAA